MAGLLCLALTLGLLPSGLVLPARAAHWADPYGQKLVEWGVMRGDVTGGDLRLDRPITRAELVAMLNRAYGYSRKAGSPFEDVPSSKWYADDIDIAYNAGYFQGTSTTPPLASPEASVTREQAAVFMARNLMLQETVGETLGFSDSRTLSEWSRGLIGAAVQENVLTGYTDGSFQPKRNITRGEMAAMLVRAIGTPVNEEGNHTLGHVYGNVTLNTSNVTLRDTTIAGNLYLTGGIDLGHVLLENVTVLGKIIVSGAGESISGQESVVLRNVEAEELVLDSLRSPFVTIKAQGVTDIPLVTVRTNAYVDDSSWEGYGLARIELRGAPGAKLQLAGSIKEVMNFTPASDLQFVKGSAKKVTVDEDATASKVLVDKNTRVDELNLDVGTIVSGEGDIGKLNVGSAGSVVEQLPDQIVIRPGIDADIDGETIGSSDAAELSAEPRLLAGYPFMKNIAPTEADGVFSASKPGTIYWAISAVADGSVSEEDLIENPAYGGNIFEEQAGTIDAGSAKTEYVSKVQKLQPDGTYYVSAVLVDGRGKHSPLKVMSFATPDNTKPAFVKDPTMTKITTDVAQTTVMANKDCLLYWALLPTGAQAPTPQEFKTGSLGGNYGYGSLNVVKNAEISVTVNRQKLREKTTYDLFLWLTDHNGAQSMDAPFKLTFTTPDETPPVVTDPQQIPPYAADSATVSFSMNEEGTLYWAVVPESDTTFISIPANATEDKIIEIMSDLRNKIRVESASDTTGGGSGATAAGKADAKTAFADVRFQITKLLIETTGTNNYWMYYIGKDAAGNYSDMVGRIDIKTLDTTPPSVEQKFTDAVGENPRASSDIRLEFSETVKGGNEAGGPTFLSLYQAVQSAVGETNIKAAKDNLAKELAAHIQMYSVPRNGQPNLLEPLGGFEGDKEDKRKDWVIDFHNARVTQENGKMVILLPNDTNNSDVSALQLASGATYYFQLLGVYDNAFIPNGILNPRTGKADPNGNLQLEPFTTIYGQVELAQNTNLTYIEDGTYDGIRLDLCVDVKPESTKNMPDTEYWDMIIWSSIGIDVQIYRQVDENDWECLNDTPIPIERTGIGLGTKVMTGRPTERFKPVVESLLQDHVYRYGIHINKIGNVEEIDPKEEPTEWGDLLTMRFSLVAGTLGDIQIVSGNVNDNYDSLVNEEKRISEIGIEYMQNGTRRILEYPKQFNDTRVPSFQNTYPRFETGSGAIKMTAGLNRPGKLWWVAAPVDTVTTGIDASTVISNTNDGSKITGHTPPDPLTSPLNPKTYIPVSGLDREANKESIYFATGIGQTNSDGTPIGGEYWSPTYRDITTERENQFGRNEAVKMGGPIEIGTATEDIHIGGLKPEQEYYIYIVLQGGGDPGHVVEIYRQTTTKITPPTITMSSTTTTATMEPIDRTQPTDKDFMLYYALVESNSLPSIFTKPRTWGTMTDTHDVIWAMTTRVNDSTGRTYFDAYAEETLKDEVRQYIIVPGSQFVGKQPVKRYEGTEQDKVEEDFDKPDLMTADSDTSEYMVLACARNVNSDESVALSYGFAAARGLYKPDLIPPEFVFSRSANGAILPYASVRLTGVYESLEDAEIDKRNRLTTAKKWYQNTPEQYMGYYYTGTVTISFTKPLYQAAEGTGGSRDRLPVWGVASGDADTGAVSIEDLINDSMVTYAGTEQKRATQTFTLEFKNFTAGSTIRLPGQGRIGNSNPSSNPSNKQLVMTFDPSLTMAEMQGLGETYVQIATGGFRVSWQATQQ